MVKGIFGRLLQVIVAALVLMWGSAAPASAQESWAVYMYVCGSDLESGEGLASANLEELFQVSLPENVTFFIQTGGAEKWHLKGVPANKLGRFIYDSKGFRQLQTLPDTSMGDKKTLAEFLAFAGEHFPADHRMVVFWDHGSGSLLGFCDDEKFGDALSLNDLQYALESSFGKNPSQLPLDMVFYDTCLMASLETANVLQGYSRYMVACQELMAGTGSDYRSWVGAIAANPAISGRELGKIICDTYMKRCADLAGTEEISNISLLDLTQMPALNAAYEKFGRAALQKAQASPQTFFTGFDRAGNTVENYGSIEGGEAVYFNMVDLGSFAEALEIPEGAALQSALADVVAYKTAGKYRRYGQGLSCYYSLDGESSSLLTYSTLPNVSPAFVKLYSLMLTPDGEGKALYAFDLAKLENKEVAVEEGKAVLRLTPEDANAISEIECLLTLRETGRELVLGTDNKLTRDWEKGVFYDEFQGEWPRLCGHVIPMYLDEAYPDYYIFGSTILLNGKKHYLTSVYDEEKKAFELLGARRILRNGQLDRDVKTLKQGDAVTPIFYDWEGKEVKGEKFTLMEEPYIEDTALAAGDYIYYFRLKAPHNEPVLTEGVEFQVDEAAKAA